MKHVYLRGWTFVITLLIVLMIAGCGGLAGEPRIVATLPPSTPVPTEVGYPLSTPDLAVGAQIFAQHCTQCHGETGRGDGTRIGNAQGQIAQPPSDFTDPSTTADQTPLDWYRTITNGRIDNLMPPWLDSLTEQERWDVAMYTYTLHYQADALTQGKALVDQNGASVANLPAPSEIVGLTDSALIAKYAESAPFVSTLDDTQKQDVAAYVRSLTLAGADLIGKPVVAPATTEEPGTALSGVPGTVSGLVTNVTAGGTVPSDLKATLHDLDSQFNDSPRETTVGADGQFMFSDVLLAADRNYIVTVLYHGRTFASDFLPGDPATAKLDLPLKIFEITNDSSVVHIAGWVSQITAVENVLQIAQVVSFINTSDKAYSNDLLANDDRYASVSVKLPPGAQVLSIAPDDQRYVLSADGLTVTDTAPVMPDEQHIIQFIYSIPYTGELRIEQPIDYAVQGPIRLLVTPDSIKVTSAQMAPLGPQTIRDQTYQGYGASLTLSAGDTLSYLVQGAVLVTDSGAVSSPASATNLLPVVLVVIGILVMLTAIVIYLRGRKPTAPVVVEGDSSVLIDGLIREIAELDESHASGEINDETYQRRRDKLKSRLTELMDEE